MKHGENCWVVAFGSGDFDACLNWVFHARRYPGIRLCVVDAGLDIQQRRKLTTEGVELLETTSLTHFDIWAALVKSDITTGSILYTFYTDLLDPNTFFDKGVDRMVFGKWPAQSEYYNVCKPATLVVDQARIANYIEAKVGQLLDGLAATSRICGPIYLWKAMVGIGNFVRRSQSPSAELWEPMVANLFAAIYPEYTLLQ